MPETQLDMFEAERRQALMDDIAAAFDRWTESDCQECGGEMGDGKAMQSTVTGIGDFDDSDRVMTVSPSGPGKLINCRKCADCGWSIAT